MEVRINIHDLEVIHKALRTYIRTTDEYPDTYNKDKVRDLTALVYGAIQDYNYRLKEGAADVK